MKYKVLFCFVLLAFSSSIFAATSIPPARCFQGSCFEFTAASSQSYFPNIENTVNLDVTNVNHNGWMAVELTALGNASGYNGIPFLCGVPSTLIEKVSFSSNGLSGYKSTFQSTVSCSGSTVFASYNGANDNLSLM